MAFDRLFLGLLATAVSWGAEEAGLPMPGPKDHGSIWWADGFPGVVEGAPWHRVIETGHFAMVLDTETLEVPHFGPLKGRSWHELPSAMLELKILVNGKSYTCTGSKGWSRHGGPRLVEAGRFFQRADVTDLIFKSKNGEELGVDARFETSAWPDRLGFVLEAHPGLAPITRGEASFGKVGGGYGLDGNHDLALPEVSQVDPNSFTWSFWSLVPVDYDSATKALPWLMCQNQNEWADGNVGITVSRGVASATMNVGGGRENQVKVVAGKVRLGAWNHFLLSYDGSDLRVNLNQGKTQTGHVGARRKASQKVMVFGRRGDKGGDGYHFKGVIDEIQLFDEVVNLAQLGKVKPVAKWGFRGEGKASEKRPKMTWEKPKLQISFFQKGKSFMNSSGVNGEVAMAFDPVTFKKCRGESDLVVAAQDLPVTYEPKLGWHRVNLDGVKPLGKGNDVVERIPLTLSNRSNHEQTANLMFEKTGRGFRGRLGSPITGVSAILCDENGEPTGIPIQLSKNWHNEEAAGVYKGAWFHGITRVRVPAKSEVKLQLVIANGHWGGVAAASHAQLSLIGWGSNQRWEQSALGCWGESICYEPAQGQANCTITDVRPLMVTPMKGNEKWNWTNNVGGGDFFRIFDQGGKRLAHQSMKVISHRQGPCLTEVEFAGRIGDGIKHSIVTSLARTDDLVRGCYRVRLDVSKAIDFSRFVIFQVGADTYNFTREGRLVFGNETGMTLEKATEPGGDLYRMKPTLIPGKTPWVSLEEGKPGNPRNGSGAWANRGIIVREWKARLGGKDAAPHFAERGVSRGNSLSSTMDLLPPAGVTRLEPGDFVEAVIEYIVMPQKAGDYYGPNLALREALENNGGSWKMIDREVSKNARNVEVVKGALVRTFPDVRIRCEGDSAAMKLSGGLGYVPLTFTNLSSYDGFVLKVGGKIVDQSVHGNDFWQTDYDPFTGKWSRTYNIPSVGGGQLLVEFGKRRLVRD